MRPDPLTPATSVRFDLGALKAAVRLSDPELADRLHITERTLLRKRLTGLTWVEADRFAVACGFHPVNVWPHWVNHLAVTTSPVRSDGAR